MKTTKIAATGYPLAGGVPFAQGQRSRQSILNGPRLSPRGGRHTECACYLSIVCLVLASGCGLEGPIPRGPKPDATAASKAAEPNVAVEHAAGAQKTPEQTSEKKAGGATGAEKALPANTVSDASRAKTTAETKPGTRREKAAVGVGERGRGYGGEPITAAIKARWSAEEIITFNKIHHDLELYKAQNGQFPKDYEEFRKEILVPSNLKLPPLPEGDSYSYDPIGGELMVEHSK